jgi:hypothetical protein
MKEVRDSAVNFYQPLYMQNSFTDNLWINQPLKEYNRYQNILFSVVFSYFTFNRTDSNGGPYIMATIPTAAVFGGAIGLGYSSSYFKTDSSDTYEKNIDFSANLQAGIKLNLLDFTYLKAGFNYHYSPILDKIADKLPDHNDSIKSNFVFIIGTELF